MSLILCPECGTKISSKATSCPHCGYVSENSSLPISIQDTYKVLPNFRYDIEGWDPIGGELSVFSPDDNKSLFEFFGSWEKIRAEIPALAEVIQALGSKEKILVADTDSYIERLIKEGTYRYSISKDGEILPTIRDAQGIVKQVRLKERTLGPDLMQSIIHLQTQAALMQILGEIEYVGEAIRELRIELQDDRLAMVESARDKLKQAQRIQDAKLREIALLNIVNSATDSKRILMRNFTHNYKYVAEHSDKSVASMVVDFKGQRDIDQNGADLFRTLISITNSVQIECEGYTMLGEYESAKECLFQFRDFISANKLADKNTMLVINSNVKQKQMRVVKEFSSITNRITNLDETTKLENRITGELTEEKEMWNEV